jgi:hypothetical protein
MQIFGVYIWSNPNTQAYTSDESLCFSSQPAVFQYDRPVGYTASGGTHKLASAKLACANTHKFAFANTHTETELFFRVFQGTIMVTYVNVIKYTAQTEPLLTQSHLQKF